MRTISCVLVAMAAFSTPATAHEFATYFDYGRADLSSAGYRMIRSVAGYAASRHPSRILIVAHMDTAEAAEFSDELSRQRAQTVASELVLLGLDPALIVMQGRGASTLARATPLNTAEPLNRRATVDVRF